MGSGYLNSVRAELLRGLGIDVNEEGKAPKIDELNEEHKDGLLTLLPEGFEIECPSKGECREWVDAKEHEEMNKNFTRWTIYLGWFHKTWSRVNEKSKMRAGGQITMLVASVVWARTDESAKHTVWQQAMLDCIEAKHMRIAREKEEAEQAEREGIVAPNHTSKKSLKKARRRRARKATSSVNTQSQDGSTSSSATAAQSDKASLSPSSPPHLDISQISAPEDNVEAAGAEPAFSNWYADSMRRYSHPVTDGHYGYTTVDPSLLHSPLSSLGHAAAAHGPSMHYSQVHVDMMTPEAGSTAFEAMSYNELCFDPFTTNDPLSYSYQAGDIEMDQYIDYRD